MYWSEELPPSRGQYRDIALVALELLGIPRPESRLDELRVRPGHGLGGMTLPVNTNGTDAETLGASA